MADLSACNALTPTRCFTVPCLLLLFADNLIIPTITELCAHIGVPNSTVGIIIGCCDIATIPATLGLLTLPHQGGSSHCRALVVGRAWLRRLRAIHTAHVNSIDAAATALLVNCASPQLCSLRHYLLCL